MAWADDLPLDAAPRGAPRAARRGAPRAGGARVALPPCRLADRRTTPGCCSTRCSAPERFLNEIVWAYDYGGRARDRWPRKHDTILWYAKGDAWTFDRDAIDRIPYLAPGLVGPEKAARGKLPTDVWWMTIVPPGSAERTGYPTQKPVRLLERIVAASSRPGRPRPRSVRRQRHDGRGGRERLGRRWLLVDRNPAAVEIARARLAAEVGGVTADPAPRPAITAITLDFGNTLVPVPASGLREVVGRTATAMAARLGPFDVDEVRRDLGRGARAPVPRGGPAVPRDRPRPADRPRPRAPARDGAAAGRCPLGRRGGGRAARSRTRSPGRWRCTRRAFIDALPPPPGRAALLARLAERYRVAILSNWPLAVTIDRYADAAGWTPSLAAIVGPQRVGTIKPHPAIFAAARSALGDPEPGVDPARRRRLGGGRRRGAAGRLARGLLPRAAADSPLPGSERDDDDPHARPGPRAGDARRPGGRARAPASVDSLLMEPRDRLANLGLLVAAVVAWILVAILVTTRDPVPGPDGRLRRRPADRARRRRDRDPAVLADRVRPSPPDRLPGRLVPGDPARRLGRPVRRGASSCCGWSTRSSRPSSCSSPRSSSSPS